MTKEIDSAISGFYKLPIEERLKVIAKLVDLNKEDIAILQNFGYFKPSQLDTLIENVIGSYQLPMGVACNFKINDMVYVNDIVDRPAIVKQETTYYILIVYIDNGILTIVTT